MARLDWRTPAAASSPAVDPCSGAGETKLSRLLGRNPHVHRLLLAALVATSGQDLFTAYDQAEAELGKQSRSWRRTWSVRIPEDLGTWTGGTWALGPGHLGGESERSDGVEVGQVLRLVLAELSPLRLGMERPVRAMT